MNSRRSKSLTAPLSRRLPCNYSWAWLLLVCGALLARPLSLTAAAAPAATPAPAKEGAKAGPEAELTRGMPAAEVKKIMGEPGNVKALEAPSGKAEVWTYVRELENRSKQVQVGSKPITISQAGSDGKLRTQTIAEEPIFRMQHLIVEEQVDLLIFNDHFLEKKVTRGQRLRYD